MTKLMKIIYNFELRKNLCQAGYFSDDLPDRESNERII